MPRTKGAKARVKDLDSLRESMQTQADEKGLDVEIVVSQKEEKTPPKLDLTDFFTTASEEDDELEVISNDVDYECGNCHKSLESELVTCPYCHINLSW